MDMLRAEAGRGGGEDGFELDLIEGGNLAE